MESSINPNNPKLVTMRRVLRRWRCGRGGCFDVGSATTEGAAKWAARAKRVLRRWWLGRGGLRGATVAGSGNLGVAKDL